MSRWPAFRVPGDWDALYSPDSGFLLTVPALRGMANAARPLGATILDQTQAVAWGSGLDSVWVDTTFERYEAGALIVTAGAWSTKILTELNLPIHILRKTLWWQEVVDPGQFHPERFPVFITDSAAGEIYGFPIYGVPGLKLAMDDRPVLPVVDAGPRRKQHDGIADSHGGKILGRAEGSALAVGRQEALRDELRGRWPRRNARGR